MGFLCLSAPSILRCASFTFLQNTLLIIPTALEVIFSTSLLFTNRGDGWHLLLLTAEGWVYFALALLEMLSHILPAARDSGTVFRIMDLVLAATSFLPILFYMLFLYFFTRAELIKTLPRRFQRISQLLLIIFIPAVVAFNEVASFVGITHRSIPTVDGSIMAIGFASDKDQLLWTFFTSTCLALLTAYQAINFMFAFYRLIRAFIDQRRIETTESDERRLFKGIGWISGALKLGAIETVVGFAQGGFGGALIRRILRFLARAILCIGLYKGMDSLEDFRQVRDELENGPKEFRRSRLRQFISNPRLSTFRQLSPTATAFHATPRAPNGLGDATPGPRASAGLPGMRQFADMREARTRQRVTVLYNGGAPTLHMRFSTLDLPSPATIVNDAKSRPQSEWGGVPYRHSTSSSSFQSPGDITYPSPAVRRENTYKAALPARYASITRDSRATSRYSAKSVPDTINAVRELAGEFPILSSSAIDKGKRRMSGERPSQPFIYRPYPKPPPAPSTITEASSAVSRNSSWSKRKPPPLPSPLPATAGHIDPFADDDDDEAESPMALEYMSTPAERNRSLKSLNSVSTRSNTPATGLSAFAQGHQQVGYTPDTDVSSSSHDHPENLRPGKQRDSTIGVARTTDWVVSNTRGMDNLPTLAMIEGRKSHASRATSREANSMRESVDDRGKSVDTLTIPWLKNPDIEEEEKQLVRALSQRPPLSRIKSVGKAPRHVTPAPIRTGHVTRDSVWIEPIMVPPREAYAGNLPEIIQGTATASSFGSRDSREGVLRDSEVLGIENGRYDRERSYFAN